jgi:RimJ/RimL family protein N-acetyltransferase
MRAIHTHRFTLEPQLSLHASEMFAVLSDPAIYEFENSPPASEAWLMERFRKLESRRSPDGSELWLNWVIRLPSDKLAGYVQATVRPNDLAQVAYEMASPFWGQGLGSAAVSAMLGEVASAYNAKHFFATLKRTNLRSLRLLTRLGFQQPAAELAARVPIEADELLMYRSGNAP